jgi:hypothetical protein
VVDNQLSQKFVCIRYCCADQTSYQNEIGWEREILRPKQSVEKNLNCCSLNKKKSNLNEKQRRLESNQALDSVQK